MEELWKPSQQPFIRPHLCDRDCDVTFVQSHKGYMWLCPGIVIHYILWYVYHIRQLPEGIKYVYARAHQRIYTAVPGLQDERKQKRKRRKLSFCFSPPFLFLLHHLVPNTWRPAHRICLAFVLSLHNKQNGL